MQTSTQQIYTKNLTQNIDIFKSLLKPQKTDSKEQNDKINSQIEQSCNDITLILEKLQKEKINLSKVLSNDYFRKLLDDISAWILKNFTSPKLTSILWLISNLFNSYDHRVEIKKKEIKNIQKPILNVCTRKYE